MTDERIKKLELAIADKEFEERIVSCSSNEELKEIMSSKGIDMSDEEIENLADRVRNMLAEGEELDEGSLEDVSGGGLVTAIVFIGGCYIAGRILGGKAGNMYWGAIR